MTNNKIRRFIVIAYEIQYNNSYCIEGNYLWDEGRIIFDL